MARRRAPGRHGQARRMLRDFTACRRGLAPPRHWSRAPRPAPPPLLFRRPSVLGAARAPPWRAGRRAVPAPSPARALPPRSNAASATSAPAPAPRASSLYRSGTRYLMYGRKVSYFCTLSTIRMVPTYLVGTTRLILPGTSPCFPSAVPPFPSWARLSRGSRTLAFSRSRVLASSLPRLLARAVAVREPDAAARGCG